ncbi:MAG: DUF2934 domain-containing protein [Shinella sp.]|jgi:hypothetical protein|nr:DUF2934 domain-containing protein [Shinella sp.]
MSDTRKEWISKRAYSIWEEQGKPHGRDAEHWEQATRERDELERVALPEHLEKTKTAKSSGKSAGKAEKEPVAKVKSPPKAAGTSKRNGAVKPV